MSIFFENASSIILRTCSGRSPFSTIAWILSVVRLSVPRAHKLLEIHRTHIQEARIAHRRDGLAVQQNPQQRSRRYDVAASVLHQRPERRECCIRTLYLVYNQQRARLARIDEEAFRYRQCGIYLIRASACLEDRSKTRFLFQIDEKRTLIFVHELFEHERLSDLTRSALDEPAVMVPFPFDETARSYVP